jgi:hypothetical protein
MQRLLLDLSRVRSIFDEIPWTRPESPFVARFPASDRQLTFVAAKHALSSDSPTFRLVRSELLARPPRLVIIEGFSSNLGIDSDELADRVQKFSVEERARSGESVQTILDPIPGRGAVSW